jgi:hypothetical protein
VHTHALVREGVFAEDATATLVFQPAPPPEGEALDALLATIAAASSGCWCGAPGDSITEWLVFSSMVELLPANKPRPPRRPTRNFNSQDAIPGVAFMPVHRAAILVDLGRSREAMPLIAAALKRADSGELPPGPSRNLRGQALRARVAAEVSMNNANAAAQTAMLLEQHANERKDDVVAQSAMHYGLGMASMGERDFTGARAHFEQCLKRDPDCRRQIVAAAQKANDKPAAEAARAAILKLYVRDPVHLWVRSRLQSKAVTSSTE